jgi:nicotinamidase-related amidase
VPKLEILVVDPQIGWSKRYPGTPVTLYKLAEWLSARNLWNLVSVSRFENDEQSPFRSNLGWWKDFRDEKSTGIVQPYGERAARTFPRNTYGMPDAYWNHLTEAGIDTLLIAGVEADASIAKIAMDAFDRNLRVFVAPHFISSAYGQQGIDISLHILSKTLGRDHMLTVGELSSMCGVFVC